MPILNGIDAAREIKKALPSTKVGVPEHALIAPFICGKRWRQALRVTYLNPERLKSLVAGIEEVLEGKVYITPGLGQDVIEKVRNSV